MCKVLRLSAVGAIAGAVWFFVPGAEPANAQCSVFSHHPCVVGVCSVFNRHGCVPGVCSVLSRRPCVGGVEYPFGEDLRLTIVSRAEEHGLGAEVAAPDSRRDEPGPVRAPAEPTNGEVAGAEHKLDTIRDLFNALRTCWVPPPQDEARPGMQMSVRLSFKRSGEMFAAPRVTYATPDAPAAARGIYHDAIMAALERCTPLPFSAGFGGAVAGRPIAIRYVDARHVP